MFNVSLYQPHDQNLIEFSLPFYVFDVAEDAVPGVTVGRVEAFVAVVGHRASSSRPTYAVMSRWASSVFHVNATYGILTLASALDYETVSRLYITIAVFASFLCLCEYWCIGSSHCGELVQSVV